MQLVSFPFILGVFVIKTVCSEFLCCRKELENGSVSYILNSSIPEGWNQIWTLNGTVIVQEDGVIDPAHVVSQTGKECILKENYSSVVCRLESPENGVSEEISCRDQCNPSSIVTTPGTMLPALNIVFIVLALALLLVLLSGLLICYCYKRRRCRDKGSDVKMQPVNQDDQKGP